MLFHDTFSLTTDLTEANPISNSSDSNWWLNSGGYLRRRGGYASTNVGNLATSDPWRTAYANSSAVDTENGYKPQNLFRLVTKLQTQINYQEVWFKLLQVNLTNSPERDAWSGILFFIRYIDGDNLYYAGIRHDGKAVIKKKRYGAYTTLGSTSVYPGTYNRTTAPNLIPEQTWIGIRASAVEESSNVRLKFEVHDGSNWVTKLSVLDSASNKITASGYAGIRTDFADLEFKNFRLSDQPLANLNLESDLQARIIELEATLAARDALIVDLRDALLDVETRAASTRS